MIKTTIETIETTCLSLQTNTLSQKLSLLSLKKESCNKDLCTVLDIIVDMSVPLRGTPLLTSSRY